MDKEKQTQAKMLLKELTNVIRRHEGDLGENIKVHLISMPHGTFLEVREGKNTIARVDTEAREDRIPFESYIADYYHSYHVPFQNMITTLNSELVKGDKNE